MAKSKKKSSSSSGASGGSGSSGASTAKPPADCGFWKRTLNSTWGFLLLVIALVAIGGLLKGMKGDASGKGSPASTNVGAQAPTIRQKLANIPRAVVMGAEKAANWLDHAGDLYPKETAPVVPYDPTTITVGKGEWSRLVRVPAGYDAVFHYDGNAIQFKINGQAFEYSSGKYWRVVGDGPQKYELGGNLPEGDLRSYRVPPDAPQGYPTTLTVFLKAL